VAIQGVIDAYELVKARPGEMPVLSQYLVITCHRSLDAESAANGDEGSARYNWTVNGAGIPWHEIFGLLDTGQILTRQDMLHAYRADED
jgi:hypothetical protein